LWVSLDQNSDETDPGEPESANPSAAWKKGGMVMKQVSRRRFLKDSMIIVGAAASLPRELQAVAAPRTATDWVTLGESGVKVTRLGIGTGSHGGRIQREMGQQEFTRLVRHAYDRGVRFFDTADSYRMHDMLGVALQGIPRDTFTIQTKMRWSGDPDPFQDIDRFRKELKTDYFDTFLLHCTRTADWPQTLQRQMDLLAEAKHRRLIRSHGVSCHGLLPLRAMVGCNWLEVAFVRVNHNGAHMDSLSGRDRDHGDRDSAVASIKKIHQQGTGVIGMKIIGNGDFTKAEDRESSIKYVMGLDFVDAVIIGFKSTAEIDEAIERMNRNLAV
jgi:1-deoxyxylulose-5-phosphate synthase